MDKCPYCGNKETCRFAGGNEPCLVNDVMFPAGEEIREDISEKED